MENVDVTNEWTGTQPNRTLANYVESMSQALFALTKKHSIKCVVLDGEGGLSFGMSPGDTITINTAVGPVDVVCEPEPDPLTFVTKPWWKRR
jgi:hypothetical protein